MNSISLYDFEKDLKSLHLDLNASEFYELTEYHSLTQEQIDAISIIFRYLSEKKKQATIDMYMKTSRLPRKEPKTFDNFDFSVIKGKDVERLKTLPSLSAIQAHKNLADSAIAECDPGSQESGLHWTSGHRQNASCSGLWL